MVLPITVITAFSNLILGVISYRKKPENASHVLLAVITLLIAIWTVFNYFSLTRETEELTLFWIRAVMFITPFLAMSLYFFLITFPEKEFKVKKNSFYIIITIGFFISIINITPFTFEKVTIVNGAIQPEINLGIIPFAFLMAWSVFGGSHNLFKRLKNYKGLQRAQIKMLFLGSILTFSLMILTNFIMVVLFKESSFVIFGPLFTLILTGFIFYSMIKHRFFGIRFMLGKTIMYLIIGIYIYATFYLVVFLQNYLWGSLYEPNAYLFGIPFTILFLYIHKLLYENLSSSEFLKSLYLYNPVQARDTFIKKVSAEIKLEKLLIIIVTELARIFQTKNIGTLLFEANTHKALYELYKGQQWKETPFSNRKRELLSLAQYWQDGHSPIIYVEEIDTHIKNSDPKYKNILEKIQRIMRENYIEVVMPLNRRVKQNGFIFLGEKGTKDAYTTEDFELLESIIGFTGIAVQNSIAHKELQSNLEIIQNFNKTLQERVDIATKELEGKVADLREARRKERDMIDIMGHELRTPLSIIKTNLDLLKNKLDKEKHKKYTKRLDEALEREILLLETMISSTKINAKRIELNMEDVDLVKSIKNSLAAFSDESKRKQLEMKFTEPKESITVYADRIRLGEILNNFLENAIKYTDKGKVEIRINLEKNYARVSVIDTGQGIPKDEIKNLGKKFYRVNQYVNEKSSKVVRPGGTGLGLYVAFGLIELMGGTYKVESEKNKGSNFSFTIPIYTQQPKSKKKEKGTKNVFERMKMKK